MNVTHIHPKNIAVIGSGISGLSCAWLLSSKHNVTLFEKDDRLGGHANTVAIEVNAEKVDVDTGFIVYNPLNYPNFVALLDYLNVATEQTVMSFAVSVNQGSLEYSGSGLKGLFAQKRNIFKPSFWLMLKDIKRFYKQAPLLEKDPASAKLTLGELLSQQGYSKVFIDNHLVPMAAAIWSAPAAEMLSYPALNFLRFCRNHGLLQLADRPQWRTVVGGSKNYVDKISAAITDINLNYKIHKVKRANNKVYLYGLHGNCNVFDDVVFACHSDQALALLDEPTEREQNILGSFPYRRNKAYLHTDTALMPKNTQVWSSWNYLLDKKKTASRLTLSYWMNELQPLATDVPLFVTLNPAKPPASQKIHRTFFYDHPLFNQASIEAQQELWKLQGQNNSWFCGAYFGYGFHEDGLQAGLAVAEQLGLCSRPWAVDSSRSRIFSEVKKTEQRDANDEG
ncbi:FAD-dependent oxidoreductase [Gammaproteobacteria bacterium AS21]